MESVGCAIMRYGSSVRRGRTHPMGVLSESRGRTIYIPPPSEINSFFKYFF